MTEQLREKSVLSQGRRGKNKASFTCSGKKCVVVSLFQSMIDSGYFYGRNVMWYIFKASTDILIFMGNYIQYPEINRSGKECKKELPSFFPALGFFPMSRLLASASQNIEASSSASVLPVNIQCWFPLNWLVWSPCCPRDSQQSSPASQFKSINIAYFR